MLARMTRRREANPMTFKRDFPDYKTYEDDEYYYSKVPPGFNGALLGLLNVATRDPETDGGLKALCHNLAGLIPCEPTGNWGRDWLLNDLESLTRQLSQKNFAKYMDFLAQSAADFDIADDLNDLADENDLGYRLVRTPNRDYEWEIRKDQISSINAVLEVQQEVKDVCAQAAEHLRKAREHLEKADDARARKDALRDSLSAMEALAKELAGDGDFANSIKKLRESKAYGDDMFVKDGLSIWNRVHDMYPDVRHGSPKVTELPVSEAMYWIDRIMVYVGYLQRRRREGGPRLI